MNIEGVTIFNEMYNDTTYYLNRVYDFIVTTTSTIAPTLWPLDMMIILRDPSQMHEQNIIHLIEIYWIMLDCSAIQFRESCIV